MKGYLDLSYFGYRLPPTERFGFVNYFAILGQCTENGLFCTTENKFFNYLKINLDVNN